MAHPKHQTRQVGPLSVRAAVGSIDDKARTVEVVFSTGAKVLRGGWFEDPFWEELSMKPEHVRLERLNAGAPFLYDHASYNVARTPGVIESARVADGKGFAKIRFVKEGIDPDADRLFEKIKDGIVRNVSVGYRVHKMERQPKAEGEKYPTRLAVDWEPHEISAVAIGADPEAGFRSGSAEQKNECVFDERTFNQPPESTEMDEQAKAEAAKVEAEKRQAELKAAGERAAQVERERVIGIRSAFRALGALSADESKKLDAMLSDATTLEAARAYVIDQVATRAEQHQTEGRARIEVGEGSSEKFVRGVSAALLGRQDNVVKAVKAREAGFEKLDLDGGEFRGIIKISDLARACIERAGVSARGLFSTESLVEKAWNTRSGGANSTSDFSVIFENILNKTMRAGYATQGNDTWRRWVGVEKVPNFQTHTRLLTGQFGTLAVVPELGEYPQHQIPDGSKVAIAVQTYGGVIGLSRQTMVNDDLGAIMRTAGEFGKTSSRTIEAAAYAMLLLNSGAGPTLSDTNPFFHSSRANISTSAALSGAALSLDRQKMRAQKDPSDKDYLDLRPSILLVPVGLEDLANQINTDPYDHDGTKLMKTNQQRGKLADIVSSPRLTSATNRYLFEEGKDAFKAVFLESSGEGPAMETEREFRRDAQQWKISMDFKMNPYDPKCAVYNVGT